MKSFFSVLFLGLLGGLFGGYFFISINDKYSASMTQAVVPAPVISAIPSQGFWDKIVSESLFTSLGIQVFQSDKLVKQGSGVVVSSDGLIVTIADLSVPNAVYQVFYGDKILRGAVVARDYNLNLLLIKTNNSYSNVADLNEREYHSGQEVILVGKVFDVSKPVVFSQRGAVSYVTEKSIIIDTVVNKNLYGAGVVDANGDLIGLAYLRGGKVNLIRVSSVEKFFQEYIGKDI
ncbi:MAG: serine protease [Candidatus Taylorbacteria bacterium]|nr:serine protease [Candidatus Taylorbacteria bacterium]